MQNLLNEDFMKEIKKVKMKKMEFELQGQSSGSFVECPQCKYISKNKRFSGKIFDNEDGKSFKCFACGLWRKI